MSDALEAGPVAQADLPHSDLVVNLFREIASRASRPGTSEPEPRSSGSPDSAGASVPTGPASADGALSGAAPGSQSVSPASEAAPPPPVHSGLEPEEPANAPAAKIPVSFEPFGSDAFKSPRESGLEEPVVPPASGHPDYYFLSGPAEPAALDHPPARGLPPPLATFDVEAVRRDFPALQQRVHGHPLVYLDNAATTQKPQAVIDATSHFYAHDNAPVHRAGYELAERATTAFENAREKVREFLGAKDKKEIVFTRGTTEAINLVANTFGRKFIGEGDEIVVSELEHHANIVPWQLLSGQTGAVIKVVPINDRGELILEEYVRLLGPRTKLVSIAHVSNSLGTINPIEQIIHLAHARGIHVLIDGAQSTPHIPINVQALDADFFVFSGHKIVGPTGIGALYGKSHLLEMLPPWQGGGHMIKDVTFEKTVFQHPPEKFEAGTPDIAGAVGLGAAIDYLLTLGIPAIAAYEHALLEYATPLLLDIPGLRLIGTAANKASVLSFVLDGHSNESVAKHLDGQGIAVRAGHHCAQPAQRHFGLESTVRPSLAFYNNRADIDALVQAIRSLIKT
ncbi:MAG: SufS family cysteine desulfurase [Verrucomicrobiae bacterium]